MGICLKPLAMALLLSLPVVALAGETSGRKMCWAHYVPWHPAENNSFAAIRYLNAPYADVTETALRDEVLFAREHGLDGFFMDVCAKVGQTVYGDLTKFLRAAEGTDFQVGLCLDVKTSVSNQVSELVKMLRLNAAHPNYPKWRGRPVVATYTWTSWTPEEWMAIRDGVKASGYDLYLVANFDNGYNKFTEERFHRYAGLFDRLYSFMSPGLSGIRADELDRRSLAACREIGAAFMPTVWPGYYGAWNGGRNDFYQPYCGFDIMQDNFLAAKETFSDWLHFTTWNDHDETTLQARRLSPALRRIIRTYCEQVKGLPVGATDPDFAFAYHREQFPGTVLRIEVMRLPCRGASAPAKVGGRLRGVDGTVVLELPNLDFSGAPWERKEWVVDTVPLAGNAELRPEFAMREGGARHQADFPSVFLVAPYLHGPETVRCAFGDLPKVEGRFSSTWADGILSASVDFAADREVKRVVLFADDLPIGQFDPNASDGIERPLLLRGRGNCEVSVSGCEVVHAVRQFNSHKDWFKWDSRTVKSCQQVEWEPVAILLRGAADATVEIRHGKDVLRFALKDFNGGRCGGMDVETGPDATVYCRRPFAVREASSRLGLACARPQPAVRYWAQIECVDGTTWESNIVHPGRPVADLSEGRVLRTPYNLDTKSGASGVPGMREFLTPTDEMCVRREEVVSAKVDSRIYRTYLCAPKGRDFALPRRLWPSGAYAIEFALTASSGAKALICHKGGMDGIGVNQLEDGRLEVVRTSGTLQEGGVVEKLVSNQRLASGSRHEVSIACDFESLTLSIDGWPDARRSITPQIRYGNCSVTLHGIDTLRFGPSVSIPGGRPKPNYVVCVNCDNDHYFLSTQLVGEVPYEERFSVCGLERYIDFITRGGRVTHVFACAVGQRADYDSKVCDPIWMSIDEAKARGVQPSEWALNAKRLHDLGIDPFKVWCDYCRHTGKVKFWISQRMNDVHHVSRDWNERTNRFWWDNPDLWRNPNADRKEVKSWTDVALDYSNLEVREFEFAIFKELVDRYDADGFELDFMRFWEHLTPGREREQAPILTDFIRRCRRYADEVGARRGCRIGLATRCPTSYAAARDLGFDPETWAKEGLIDILVVANFWAANDYDFDFAGWKRRIAAVNPKTLVLPSAGDNVGCGVDVVPVSVEAFRGWADNQYAAGADGFYLFNFGWISRSVRDELLDGGFGRDDCMKSPRRYICSFHDCTKTPAQAERQLPRKLDGEAELTIRVGRPSGAAAAVILGFDQDCPAPGVQVNGLSAGAGKSLKTLAPYGKTVKCAWRFELQPKTLRSGRNRLSVSSIPGASAVWAEIVD